MISTRDKIILVSEDLIQKIGVSAMSYQNISDEIGIKKASIHHHFTKKDILIKELVNKCTDVYVEKYKNIIKSDINSVQKLEKIADLFSKTLKEGKVCIFGILSADINIIDNETKIALEDSLAKTINLFSEIFTEGKNDKSLNFNESSDVCAYTFFSTLQGLQIVSRVSMNTEAFDNSIKALIYSWKA
ncbi:MAG: TetR/AcrR family transcriptional regulator [Campylobacteraceae bacterium]|nr:TetR/AcrR family transcriptional regulator [Campylobacteraceae bacterium]